MKREYRASKTRRGLLAALCAVPISFRSARGKAQPRQMELASYFLGPTLRGKGMQLFADKVTEGSVGTIEVSLEIVAPTMPYHMLSRASDFAHYYPSLFADIEPVFGLSALPMLTATFDEAETLLRIARPYYCFALARHGQILLATEPWQPGALWSTFRIRSIADLKDVPFAVSTPFAEQSGWGRIFLGSGARRVSYFDAELMLSHGYNQSVRFTQEFAYLTQIFFPAPLNFLTVSREVFDSLTEVQQQVLVSTACEIELEMWKLNRELLVRDCDDIAARGVTIDAQAPADVLAALRAAAEPAIQSWARSVGADGPTIIADYRHTVGRS